MGKFVNLMKSLWDFIWNSNSIWSWILNIILAFVLIKFLVYPALGLILGSSHPVVAVVSGSMEHSHLEYDEWWNAKGQFYENLGIDKYEFAAFNYKDGFNTGDIMMLKRVGTEGPQVGDIVVYQGMKRDPIIHRVVKVWKEKGEFYIQTKGDHNRDSSMEEMKISENQIIGKAFFRIKGLGWLKIGFINGISGISELGEYIAPVKEATPSKKVT